MAGAATPDKLAVLALTVIRAAVGSRSSSHCITCPATVLPGSQAQTRQTRTHDVIAYSLQRVACSAMPPRQPSLREESADTRKQGAELRMSTYNRRMQQKHGQSCFTCLAGHVQGGGARVPGFPGHDAKASRFEGAFDGTHIVHREPLDVHDRCIWPRHLLPIPARPPRDTRAVSTG